MASLRRPAILSLRRACSPIRPSTPPERGQEPVSGVSRLRSPASHRSRRARDGHHRKGRAAARGHARATLAVAVALLVGALAGTGHAGDPPIAAPRADLGFYVVHVAPLLDAKCASCHRAAGAGAFRLGDPQAEKRADLARREAELASIARLLDPEAPWRSRFLLKLLDEAEGGLPHAGGVFFRADDDAYDVLLDFAAGATVKNLPPEPEPGKDRRGELGVEARFDGGASYDRDDDPLVHRWELFARPPGSKAVLTERSEPTTALRPDVAGTYVLRLRVFDGKVWSGAKPVVLEVLERTGPTTPDAVEASGLATLDPAALRRVRSVYGDVLGRPPTPPEALLHAKRPAREVATILLSTLEAGRAWVEDAAYRLGLVGDAEPLSPAVQELPFRLAAGELTPAAAEAALALDPAFLRAHPPGDALARAVATRLFERAVGPDDLHVGRDPTALAGLLSGQAFATVAARRFARRFLAEADAAALPEARSGDDTVTLAKAWVGSEAWAGAREARRPATDLGFVRAAFADLLGRRPTAGEAAALARASAVLPGRGAGRAAVVAVLLDSGEVPLPLLVDLPQPDAWLADRFLRTLGRAPTADEAKVYRAALLDPAGGPRLVLRALLTSAEYASR